MGTTDSTAFVDCCSASKDSEHLSLTQIQAPEKQTSKRMRRKPVKKMTTHEVIAQHSQRLSNYINVRSQMNSVLYSECSQDMTKRVNSKE